jgi:hypothetical protein
MKAKLITAAVIFFVPAMLWDASPAYARAGGGGRGGGGFHGGGGGFRGGSFARGHGAVGGFRGGNHFAAGQRTFGPRYSGAAVPRYSAAAVPRYSGAARPRYSGSGGARYSAAGGNSFRNFSGKHGLRHHPGNGFVATRTNSGRTGNWARNHRANNNRFSWNTEQKLRNWPGRTSTFAQARRNHGEHGHHHGRGWWHHHCNAIILVGGGYWGWYDGWWYPAWGYDPYYSSYDYDGPIYGSDGMAPDEAIANVQSELQRLGYYSGPIDGVLGEQTRAAIERYQADENLPITGAIDESIVQALSVG